MRVVDRLINANAWYLWSWKISDNEGFRQVSLNNERSTVSPLMDTEISNSLVRLHFYDDFSEIGTLLWKFVSKIDALVLFISDFNSDGLFNK